MGALKESVDGWMDIIVGAFTARLGRWPVWGEGGGLRGQPNVQALFSASLERRPMFKCI